MSETCNLFTVDVEDWYCILDVGGPEADEWASLPCRLHAPIRKLLTLLDSAKATAIFFVLAWVAERYPDILREMKEAGHEIGSHGYAHRLIYQQTPEEFREDLRRSKKAIEDACGIIPFAYRAPGFSITPQTSWAFEVLIEEGFAVDSSVFPAKRGHGGWSGFCRTPCRVATKSGTILELPITTYDLLGMRLPFSGGGYLRLLPYPLVRHLTKSLNCSGVPVIFYLHPREIDPSHPRLSMNPYRRFKSYVGIRSTLPKLRRLLGDLQLTNLRNLVEWSQSGSLPVVDMRQTSSGAS